MRRLLTAALLGTIMISPAHADPVSIGVAVTAIGSWWASIGVVGQVLVQVGVILALSGISYLLTGGSRAAQAQKDNLPSVNIPQRDGLLEKVRLYGTATSPGGVWYQNVKNGSRYVFGVAISEGECESLVSVIINGVECVFGADGYAKTAPWFDGSVSYAQVSFRSGSDAQAIDPIIAANFSEGVDFRQRGICTVVMAMEFGNDATHHATLWGTAGIPQLLFRIKGLKVYDPRDATQNPADKTTWKWTDNATLVEVDWLTTRMGFGMAKTDLDIPTIVESSNIDASVVATLAGSEAMGRINGRAFSSEANADVLVSMMQQNRGIIRRTGEVWGIRSDRAADPVSTIHDYLLVGDISAQNEPDTRSALNTVYAEFQPYSKFNQKSETVYRNTALVTSDGEELSARASFRFGDSSAASQRLGYAMVTENRDGSSRTLNTDIAVLYAPGKANNTLEEGDVTRLELRLYPSLNGLYTVQKLEIMADMTVMLTLAGYDPTAISGWSVDKEIAFNG
jgi:hypothetical protein